MELCRSNEHDAVQLASGERKMQLMRYTARVQHFIRNRIFCFCERSRSHKGLWKGQLGVRNVPTHPRTEGRHGYPRVACKAF